MSKNAAIVIQVDQVDWIRRHPIRFVASLLSRVEQGELDRYPGYARWNGDGVPGVQVVWVGEHESTGVIAVGKGHGKRLGMCSTPNNGSDASKLDILKELAGQLGYTLRKKATTTKRNKKKSNGKA